MVEAQKRPKIKQLVLYVLLRFRLSQAQKGLNNYISGSNFLSWQILNGQTKLKLIQKRKTTRKLIDQSAEVIKQPETESGSSKQLLDNFQTENSCNH